MTNDTTTTTDKKKRIKIFMSERSPVSIDPAEWPPIAEGSAHSGQYDFQANETWFIKVRENVKDGRRIVYGSHESGPGGMPIGWRGAGAGFLIPSGADEQETVRAIRRVAGVIENNHVADECIGDLPAEKL